MSQQFVAILMGSDSDLPVMQPPIADAVLAQRLVDGRAVNVQAIRDKNTELKFKL